MAIPFNVPSDEYTLDQYRRIHQLMLDLIDLLRTFTGLEFIRTSEQDRENTASGARAAAGAESQNAPTVVNRQSSNEVAGQNVLPDIVNSTMGPANQRLGTSDRAAVTLNSGSATMECAHCIDLNAGVAAAASSTSRNMVRGKVGKKKDKPPENPESTEEVLTETQILPDILATTAISNMYKMAQTPEQLASSRGRKRRGPINCPNCAAIQFTETVAKCCCRGGCHFVCDHHRPCSRKTVDVNKQCAHSSSFKLPTWLQIGKDLKKLVADFGNTFMSDENLEQPTSEEANFLLPFLASKNFKRTMIASVLIYIGWKLLKQT